MPTHQQGVFGGAILGVDKSDFDAQFGFANGFATKELTGTELQYIKQGSQLSVEINGDYPRHWSLRGSTAAILKVTECNTNAGNVSAAQTQPAPAPAAPPSQPNIVAANCNSPTSGNFPCNVIVMQPEPGYREAYQIDPTAGYSPSYFFKIRSDFEADVWTMDNGGPWRFLGVWEPTQPGSNCTQPRAHQSNEAQNNLGQDAWGLCVQ